MNNSAKFDADSFILAGEMHNHTNTHKTNKQKTVTDISTPCLSTCVNNKDNINF